MKLHDELYLNYAKVFIYVHILAYSILCHEMITKSFLPPLYFSIACLLISDWHVYRLVNSFCSWFLWSSISTTVPWCLPSASLRNLFSTILWNQLFFSEWLWLWSSMLFHQFLYFPFIVFPLIFSYPSLVKSFSLYPISYHVSHPRNANVITVAIFQFLHLEISLFKLPSLLLALNPL